MAGEVGYRYRSEWWLGDASAPERELVNGIPWTAQLGWSPRLKERELGWMFASVGGINNPSADDLTKQFVQASVGAGIQIIDHLYAELGYSDMIWTRTAAPGGGLNLGLSLNN